MTTRDGRHLIALSTVFLLLGILTAAPARAQEGAPEGVGSSDWRSVSAGGNHTCGIRAPGQLWCWGDDSAGQLGNGPGVTAEQPVPVRVGTASDWRSVSAGILHTCGIRAPGRLWCWGSDAMSQLGDATSAVSQPSPVAVSPGVRTWTSVSAGFQHTCGRRANGRLYCWGYDGHGQLGNGAPTDLRPTPGLVKGGFTNWTSVSVGAHTTCGRRANGRLYCWGEDHFGMLGNGGNDVERATPGLVAGGATNWVSVTVGDTHVCARRSTNKVFCWGSDSNGQLGNGPAATGARDTPQLVVGGTPWKKVSAGGLHACGRTATGRIRCWGDADSGQSGANTDGGILASPVGVAGGATDWATVELGGFHTCARTTTGRLYCWGEDSDGAVGNDEDFADTSRPDEVFVF